MQPFNPQIFLSQVGNGKKRLACSQKQTIFTQGDTADAVYYIQEGQVKLSVVSRQGKEAIIAIVEQTGFFGEECLGGQQVWMASAIAMEDCTLFCIDKQRMIQALRDEPTLSSLFMKHLLARNMRIQEDLVDQLFNSAEKRLARVLLLMAHFGKESKPEPVLTRVSQETLAEMIGTTRSRVSFFMNKFRKLGFIDYDGDSHHGLCVHKSLLNIVLHD